MNTAENNTENNTENTPADRSRPFGFWITAVDRLMAARFATAFEDEGVTRRDWRILNVIDGTVPTGRELPAGKVRRLVELGWVEPGSEGWALTTDGAAAKARLTTAVEEIRAQVAGALDPEEFAAMAASLEKLARGLGYEEGMRLPRRRAGERREGGHGRGHRGHHRGYGDHRRSHGEHRHEAGFGYRERFARGEHRHESDFGAGEHFARGEGPGFDRFADHPGFGREWLQREHLRQEHARHPHRCSGHADGEREHGKRQHGERQHGDRLREHRHGEHSRGMGPRGGFHRHTPEQIHIHLHDGRHDG